MGRIKKLTKPGFFDIKRLWQEFWWLRPSDEVRFFGLSFSLLTKLLKGKSS